LYFDESLKDVYLRLNSSGNGLNDDQAAERIKEFGPNTIKPKKRNVALTIIVNQFKNFLIILLIFAAVISFFIGDILEFYGILAIIALSTILGFIQEYRAEKAMETLEKISAPFAKVLRDGKEKKVPADEIVPGDIVLLEEGDIVPADLRLVECDSLEIDESSLTGESIPSKKLVEQLAQNISIPDQKNMVFAGTVVTCGDGKGVVTSTGLKTEFGKIADTINTIRETAAPLQVKFEKMARQLTTGVIILVALVFIMGIIMSKPTNNWTKLIIELFVFSLSLAVAAVPSALPAIVTISLGLGAKRLASKNMIIKKLPAAESLGSVTVICSDKTGTLTKNEMTITKIFTDNKSIDVTGLGYTPSGEFKFKDKVLDPMKNKNLQCLFNAGYLCNNSKLVNNDGRWSVIGDPTEGSLIVLSKKAISDDKFFEENFNKIKEIPFDSNRKAMSVVYENYKSEKTESYVKGAPDIILNMCDKILISGKSRKITKKDKDMILQTNNEFADNSLRVLALAYKNAGSIRKYEISSVEKNLIFIGLVGMIDPPREGVKEAIAQAEEAGIKVMMITGDHPATARAIARDIGLMKEGDMVLTGMELDALSDLELEERIDNIRIIARALPIQKTRIVDALKKKGHIVAMTGDGVNDAPALKKADVGIAMGINGTDISKEVAQTILADDHFVTIVNAIAEGRNIYDKIIKSTKYLLSCNVGEVTAVFLAIVFGFPLPMIPLQLLLMNLLTDGVPAIGLGAENAEDDVMKRAPRNPKDNPLTKEMTWLIVIFGLAMGLGTLFVFSLYQNTNIQLARTMAFTTLVMFEMFAVMSARSFASFKKISPFSNKWLTMGILFSIIVQVAVIYVAPLQAMFQTVPLGINEWFIILIISSFGFIMMEVSKLFVKEHYNTPVKKEVILPKIVDTLTH